ncbi:MAG: tetratricopeptide repeat protein [Gemmatimonadota bacterium]|nr:MAG: tetratricopeptide repeat protein [Gemmatimonadota bacterium]
MSDVVRRLRERRIGQWAVAYLAGAWLFLEAFDFVVATFGWPPYLVRSATLLAAVGFFAVLVLAWHHGARGRQQVGGRELGLLAPLILIAAVALSLWGRPGEDSGASGASLSASGPLYTKSVAVLPFAAIGRSEDDVTFADGIHEDVITQLAKIGDLRVIARTSVMAYRDAEERVREIGRDLGVASVLEGSVRRAGDRVRVVAQLIDVETEGHLWAETYDRDVADIFAIQSELAQNIASALRATLTPEERQSIEERPTQDLEAYNYYLKGNYYVANRYSLEGMEAAAEMYDMATELDPSFALAYAKLAVVHARLYVPSSWDHTPERLQKGRAALATALELAPELAEVHRARGNYLEWIERDYEGALAAYRRALEDRPNDAVLLSDMGSLLLSRGEAEEATDLFIASYERDPKSLFQGYQVAWAYLVQRRWAEADRWLDIYIANRPDYGLGYFKKVEVRLWGYGDLAGAAAALEEGARHVENYPAAFYRVLIALYGRDYETALALVEADSLRPFYWKAQLLELMGRAEAAGAEYEAALRVYEELIRERPDHAFYHSSLGFIYAKLGRRDEALAHGRRALELRPTLSDPWASGEEQLFHFAETLVVLGQPEEAIAHLETLLTVRSEVTRWRLRLEPSFDPLRDHPRFQALLQGSD